MSPKRFHLGTFWTTTYDKSLIRRPLGPHHSFLSFLAIHHVFQQRFPYVMPQAFLSRAFPFLPDLRHPEGQAKKYLKKHSKSCEFSTLFVDFTSFLRPPQKNYSPDGIGQEQRGHHHGVALCAHPLRRRHRGLRGPRRRLWRPDEVLPSRGTTPRTPHRATSWQ